MVDGISWINRYWIFGFNVDSSIRNNGNLEIMD